MRVSNFKVFNGTLAAICLCFAVGAASCASENSASNSAVQIDPEDEWIQADSESGIDVSFDDEQTVADSNDGPAAAEVNVDYADEVELKDSASGSFETSIEDFVDESADDEAASDDASDDSADLLAAFDENVELDADVETEDVADDASDDSADLLAAFDENVELDADVETETASENALDDTVDLTSAFDDSAEVEDTVATENSSEDALDDSAVLLDVSYDSTEAEEYPENAVQVGESGANGEAIEIEAADEADGSDAAIVAVEAEPAAEDAVEESVSEEPKAEENTADETVAVEENESADAEPADGGEIVIDLVDDSADDSDAANVAVEAEPAAEDAVEESVSEEPQAEENTADETVAVEENESADAADESAAAEDGDEEMSASEIINRLTSAEESAEVAVEVAVEVEVEEPQAEEAAVVEEPQAEETAVVEEPQAEETAVVEEPQAEEAAVVEEPQAEEAAAVEEPQAEESAPIEGSKGKAPVAEENAVEEAVAVEEPKAEEAAPAEEVKAEEPKAEEQPAVENNASEVETEVAPACAPVAVTSGWVAVKPNPTVKAEVKSGVHEEVAPAQELKDQIWIVSSNGSGFYCQVLENNTWRQASADEFFANDSAERPTIVWAHGFQTDVNGAANAAYVFRATLDRVRQAVGKTCAVRLVVWKWNSERVTPRIRVDAEMKAAIADNEGPALAKFVGRINGSNNVAFVGFSFGARVVGSALQAMATTNNAYMANHTGRVSLALVSAACDYNAYAWKYAKGSAIPSYVLNVYNPADYALRFYPAVSESGSQAQGVFPISGGAFTGASGNVYNLNVNYGVGKEHSFVDEIQSVQYNVLADALL